MVLGMKQLKEFTADLDALDGAYWTSVFLTFLGVLTTLVLLGIKDTVALGSGIFTVVLIMVTLILFRFCDKRSDKQIAFLTWTMRKNARFANDGMTDLQFYSMLNLDLEMESYIAQQHINGENTL